MRMSLTNNIGIVELSTSGKSNNNKTRAHMRNSSFDMNEAIGNIVDIDDNNKPTFNITNTIIQEEPACVDNECVDKECVDKECTNTCTEERNNGENNTTETGVEQIPEQSEKINNTDNELNTISEKCEDENNENEGNDEINENEIKTIASLNTEAEFKAVAIKSEVNEMVDAELKIKGKLQEPIVPLKIKKLHRLHMRGHSQSVTQFPVKKINDIIQAQSLSLSLSPRSSKNKFKYIATSERTTPEIYTPTKKINVNEKEVLSYSKTPTLQNIRDLRSEFSRTKNTIWKSDNNLLSQHKLLMSESDTNKRQDDEQKTIFAKDIKCADLNGQIGSFQKLTVDKLTVDKLIVNELEVNKINGITKDDLENIILKLDQVENTINNMSKQAIIDCQSPSHDNTNGSTDVNADELTDEIKIAEKTDDATVQHKKTSLAISGNTCCVIM